MEVRRQSSNSSLWVFGYGSLCWHPGFQFDDSVTGFILGFARKFWQGNVTHRGVEGKPGRVATLVEDQEGMVWGRAFQLSGEAALPYLNNRECVLGGYLTTISTFYPRQDERQLAPFPALVYIAMPGNAHWLGDAPLHDIASQIVSSSGPSGHNVEYLLRLAAFIRDSIPEAEDNHLFTLEFLVRTAIKESQLCMKSLMGERASPPKSPEREAQPEEEDAAAALPRVDTFEFTSRVPPKKLRCLNI